jgi:GDP-L-fucose synthase
MSSFVSKNSKIFIAGHRGMVGSAITAKLKEVGYPNLLFKTRQELDLLDTKNVFDFLKSEKINVVIDAAAKVGGIVSNNTYRADFIYQNIQMQNNLIWGAHAAGVEHCVFLGSSCIYPKECPQPIKEEYFLDGKPEPTNIPYAAAKIAGILTCQAFHKQYGDNFISVMPTNLYGPNDNFDLATSHVFPALIRKFHEAKVANAPTVTVWGTGSPKREFLHADDLAAACVHLMKTYNDPEIVNIGTGEDVSIKEFAELVREVVGYTGEIVWDTTKPDGTPRKLLDVSKVNGLGWKASISLRDGIAKTYAWFVENVR